MSLDEPPLEPTEPVPAAAAPGSAAVPTRQRRRLLLVGVLGGVLVLALLAVGGYLVFQKITGPDRSTPAVVADHFLEGALLNRNAAQAAPFVCGTFDLAAFIASLPSLDPQVGTSWGDMSEAITGNTATVQVTIRYTVMANGPVPRDFEDWRLDLVQDGGWRVCGVTRPLLNP